MSYRDELEALRLKNEELIRDLAEAREKISELENGANEKLVKTEPAPLAEPKPPMRMGRIHFHRPRTLLPMLHLWKASLYASLNRAPKLDSFDSQSVLAWVGHYCLLVPLTYGLRIPLYYLSLCFVLPIALVICIVLSLPFLFVVLASRFTFSSVPPFDDDGWFQGKATEDQGAMFLWVLESMCMQPFLVTTTSLLEGTGSSSD